MMKAYFRPPDQRTAKTDRNVTAKLPVGLRLHGGRVDLLTLEDAEQLLDQLTEAVQLARTEA